MIFSSLDFNDNEPIYKQIENYIKHMIDNKMIAGNGKLPATRELGRILGVSRNSIITAYENLESDGVIYTVKGKGTFVTPIKSNDREKWNISWENKINNYGKLANELDVVKSEIPWEKDIISFKSISPDGALFNIEEFKKSFLNRISIEEHKILNYGYAKGYKPLIDWLLKYMQKKGIDTDGKDILVTNGFTEGLEVILSSFTNPGDKIICENPTHNTAIKIMKVHGIDIIGIKMNEDGLDIEELKEKLQLDNIKFGYLIPSYHNPTGLVMKGEKRHQVYNLFKEYNIPILEDGFNEELLYNSTHLSPIASFDIGGSGVIYLSSFSKILFPGLRIGWILADKKLITLLESVKRCKNIHTSFLDQGILYEYLNEGYFEKNIKKVKKVYREKYNFAIKCIKKYIDPEILWGEGGLHIYVGLKDINSRELLERCYEKKVIFMPGDLFSIDSYSDNAFRIGLPRLTLEQIEKGVKIIGETIKEIRREK
ncbi:PLP-dependent aminotransferase family protein [uncultured Clostridium sp.]|uniref:aminotransferase-like domain-containing protein n=1 Tax=uncultured Clostridium sp. TaxID=59620 RepID=UPI0026393750|nr:PLP-dependent aminotransferase family protein [uncultured Clostridium sp.]